MLNWYELCTHTHSHIHTHTHTQAAFTQVEFIQANLAHSTSAERAFADDQPFDVVYNLAAETKYGQSDEVSVNEMVWWVGL